MPADLSPVRPGNAERLSRMVQLATTAEDGDEPFAAFEALLAAECPRAHARLALEKVTDRGLLYLWKGASSDRPVVLMAHYDVVPADEGWNPFDVAKRRCDGRLQALRLALPIALVGTLGIVPNVSTTVRERDPDQINIYASDSATFNERTTRVRPISELGWTIEQASAMRHKLSAWADDWNDPAMDAYDAL